MAGGNAQLNFAIKAINEASKTLKEIEGDVDNLGKSADKGGGMLGKLGGGLAEVGKIAGGFIVAQGVMKLGGFLTDAAKGAAEDEAATIRLNKALDNYIISTGGASEETQELIDDMNERIAAGQKLAFSDDAIRDSMQQLLAATGDYGEASKRQTAAMDLARGANIDLGTASKLLGKLTDENIQVFKKMGITIKEGATEAEVLGIVNEKWGGQAESFAKSSAGMYAQSQLRMAEMKESIGAAVLPIFVKLGTVVAEEVFPRIEKAITAISPILQRIGEWIREHVFPVMERLGEVVREKFATFRVYYDESIKPALDNIRAGVEAVIGFIVENWPTIWTVVGPIVAQIRNTFETVFAVITGLIDAVIKLIGGDFSGAWRALGGVVDAVWNGMVGTAKNSANLIIGIINALIRAWNGLSFRVPLGFGQSVDISPPNLPEIPTLAEGGIIKARAGGTLAIIGEGGEDEAVVPLSRLGNMGGGGVVIHYHQHGPVYGMLDLRSQVLDFVRDGVRGGSFRGVIPGAA